MSGTDPTGPGLSGAPLPRRQLLFFLPALVFLVFAVLVAWFMLSGRDPKAIPSVLLDKPAPAFSLPAVDGLDRRGFGRADLSGGVTVLNVFASWCTPCLIEHPQIMALAGERGVRLFGLNYKNKDAKAVAWLERNGNPYARVGADRDGRVGIEWGVRAVPETFVLDHAGTICFKHVGPITPDVLSDQILPLVRALRGKTCGALKNRQG